ncbi:hypothetical protein BGW36DRAFT_368632 [Talaromyces proteolyticus]|uniref:Uncharacterized protein n=1 Tax=Talaromyces proteolyticus TaxID=1131652 RepID=A0AAD4L532_9EURO|nr:uncharacterized protein BGW36DRAFT_368632 [Talaromyces proteolyticus]KAH8706043.1 hypothetical protein BGW36DRAFT_368632 [Talaromyces proteolyticus]
MLISTSKCSTSVLDAKPPHLCIEPVQQLKYRTRCTLESLSTTIIEMDFPFLRYIQGKVFLNQCCKWLAYPKAR